MVGQVLNEFKRGARNHNCWRKHHPVKTGRNYGERDSKGWEQLDRTQTEHMLKDDFAETAPLVLDLLPDARSSALNTIQNWICQF